MTDGGDQGKASRSPSEQDLISKLTKSVGHLEATSEQQGELIRSVKNDVSDLWQKIDAVLQRLEDKTRYPLIPVITVMIVGASFMVTLGGILVRGLSEADERQTAAIVRGQTHLQSFIQDNRKRTQAISDRIASGMKPESVKGFAKQAINHLEETDAQIDKRIDDLVSIDRMFRKQHAVTEARVGRVETQLEERLNLMEQKVSDRWTGGQQAEHDKRMQDAHAGMQRENDLRFAPLEESYRLNQRGLGRRRIAEPIK